MSPDFEYLWRLRVEWRWSHTPLGVFTFCLPVGLGAVVVWVGLLRTPTRRLFALPQSTLSTSAPWWILAALAIVFGAATHVFWDGFTHAFGWATTLLPSLRGTIQLGSFPIPLYMLLQHISTMIGGLVVGAWFLHEVRSGTPRTLLTPWRLAVFGLITGIATLLGAWNALRGGAPSGTWSAEIRAGRAAVGALLGIVIGLAAYSLVHHLVARDTAHRGA